MMVIEMGNSLIIMPPNQEMMKDPAALCDYMRNGPAKAYIVVLIGYFLASFAAGFIVTKMSRRESPGLMLPIIVGALLTLSAIGNLVMVPCQPVWFAVIAVITFLPVTIIGHRFAAGRF
jgi:biotin transporter BioY